MEDTVVLRHGVLQQLILAAWGSQFDAKNILHEGNVWEQFKAAVTTRRKIDAAYMEGQSFYGSDARDKGLVDACAYSLDEVESRLMKRHSRNCTSVMVFFCGQV